MKSFNPRAREDATTLPSRQDFKWLQVSTHAPVRTRHDDARCLLWLGQFQPTRP